MQTHACSTSTVPSTFIFSVSLKTHTHTHSYCSRRWDVRHCWSCRLGGSGGCLSKVEMSIDLHLSLFDLISFWLVDHWKKKKSIKRRTQCIFMHFESYDWSDEKFNKPTKQNICVTHMSESISYPLTVNRKLTYWTKWESHRVRLELIWM